MARRKRIVRNPKKSTPAKRKTVRKAVRKVVKKRSKGK